MLTVLILTKDEVLHIERAIASVSAIAERVVVVDSGSTDGTQDLARALGAEVLHKPWINYATQFNWALDQLSADTEWVLRLDADEIVSPELAREISEILPTLGAEVEGVYIPRRMAETLTSTSELASDLVALWAAARPDRSKPET